MDASTAKYTKSYYRGVISGNNFAVYKIIVNTEKILDPNHHMLTRLPHYVYPAIIQEVIPNNLKNPVMTTIPEFEFNRIKDLKVEDEATVHVSEEFNTIDIYALEGYKVVYKAKACIDEVVDKLRKRLDEQSKIQTAISNLANNISMIPKISLN